MRGTEHNETDVLFWPANRSGALARGSLWIAATFLLCVVTFTIYQSLAPGWEGVANQRLIDYAIGIAALPLPILGLFTAWKGLQWLLLSLWPTAVGVFARSFELELRLGPFGTKRFPVGNLDMKYPFELSGDFEDGGFEAFLPEEQQRNEFLPQMTHAASRQPINRIILRYAKGTEADIAQHLRPMIDRWRGETA